MGYKKLVAQAVQHFWSVRTHQHDRQGEGSGKKDLGNRSSVTGGKHLEGFITLFKGILIESGLPGSFIHTRKTTLPGYFRPTKSWDLIVVDNGRLLASIELKAHIGPSFGNNFNNRVEEALGNSMDLFEAYRRGRFKVTQRPWLGWMMLLEDTPKATLPVKVDEPHFEVFPEFNETSYAKRYEIFCERLMRERLYDATCLILSDEKGGLKGKYTEPNSDFGFDSFSNSLRAHTMAFRTAR
jgi:hypothetical protein